MHDTRHTFVTVLEHGAVDSSTTRSFSGHSKDAMLKRYAHAIPDSRARAMQIVERELAGLQTIDSALDPEKIYRDIKKGKITLAEFKTILESFSGFLAHDSKQDVQNVQNVQDANSEFMQ